MGLFVLTLAPTFADSADFEVFASVDRNEMGTGDTFTYSISVSSQNSTNVDQPRLPNLPDFDLLNTWSGTESQSGFSNGSFTVRQTRNFNYMLAPRRQGKLHIGSSQVVVNGKTFNTKPIIVTVSNSQAVPPQARGRTRRQFPQNQVQDQMEEMENLFNQLLERNMQGPRGQPVNPNESFFIDVQADKKEAYVGEQITASWYLYTRGQIRDIDTLKYPSVNGFWKEDIELATQLSFDQEVINGIVYRKALLASYALFPLKAGQSVIDSYKARCTVITPS
ncbi:MAG: BatD family protein, partial [Bdellovibrionales bacterium]|nr:BatD family protein [Bdellovibrionales bacterium]